MLSCLCLRFKAFWGTGVASGVSPTIWQLASLMQDVARVHEASFAAVQPLMGLANVISTSF